MRKKVVFFLVAAFTLLLLSTKAALAASYPISNYSELINFLVSGQPEAELQANVVIDLPPGEHLHITESFTINTGAYGITVKQGTVHMTGAAMLSGSGATEPVISVIEGGELKVGGSVQITSEADSGTAVYLNNGKLSAHYKSDYNSCALIEARGENAYAVRADGAVSLMHLLLSATNTGAVAVKSSDDISLTLCDVYTGLNSLPAHSDRGTILFDTCNANAGAVPTATEIWRTISAINGSSSPEFSMYIGESTAGTVLGGPVNASITLSAPPYPDITLDGLIQINTRRISLDRPQTLDTPIKVQLFYVPLDDAWQKAKLTISPFTQIGFNLTPKKTTRQFYDFIVPSVDILIEPPMLNPMTPYENYFTLYRADEPLYFHRHSTDGYAIVVTKEYITMPLWLFERGMKLQLVCKGIESPVLVLSKAEDGTLLLTTEPLRDPMAKTYDTWFDILLPLRYWPDEGLQGERPRGVNGAFVADGWPSPPPIITNDDAEPVVARIAPSPIPTLTPVPVPSQTPSLQKPPRRTPAENISVAEVQETVTPVKVPPTPSPTPMPILSMPAAAALQPTLSPSPLPVVAANAAENPTRPARLRALGIALIALPGGGSALALFLLKKRRSANKT